MRRVLLSSIASGAALLGAAGTAHAGAHASATVSIETEPFEAGPLTHAPRHRVVVQLGCTGTKSPRLSWGMTQWFYVSSMQKKGGAKIAAPGLRLGAGETDAATMTLRSEWTELAGAVVMPELEAVGCVDLDDKKNSDTHKVIDGEMAWFPPFARLLGYVDPSNNTMYDNAALPADAYVHPLFLINAHPSGDECLIMRIRMEGYEQSSGYHAEDQLPMICGPQHFTNPRFHDLMIGSDQLGAVDGAVVMPLGVGIYTPPVPHGLFYFDWHASMWLDEHVQSQNTTMAELVMTEFLGGGWPLVLASLAFDKITYGDNDRVFEASTYSSTVAMPPGAAPEIPYNQPGFVKLGDLDTDAIPAGEGLAGAGTKGTLGKAAKTSSGATLTVDKIEYRPVKRDDVVMEQHLVAHVRVTGASKEPYMFLGDHLKASYVSTRGVERTSLYGHQVSITDDKTGKPLALSAMLAQGATVTATIDFLTRYEWQEQPMPKTLSVNLDDVILDFDVAKLAPKRVWNEPAPPKDPEPLPPLPANLPKLGKGVRTTPTSVTPPSKTK